MCLAGIVLLLNLSIFNFTYVLGMKKLWLFFSCCVLLGTLNAQTSIGIRGGKSFSRVNFAPVPPQALVEGIEGGIILRHMNSRHLGIQLELNVSSQGWSIYPTVDSLAHTKQVQYIQVPLLTHVQLGRGRFTFAVQAGALAAYAFSEKDGNKPVYTDAHRQQAFLPWQFGMLASAGPAFRFNFGELKLEARFAQHLSNLLEANLSQTEGFTISQQQIITFGLQWLYTF